MKPYCIILLFIKLIKTIESRRIVHLILFALPVSLAFFQNLHVNAQTNYSWTGAVSQAYNTPGNWSPAGVPGPNDTIIVSSGTVTVSTGSPVIIGGIYFSGGTIETNDSVVFTKKMIWTSGTLSGTGKLTCPLNAELKIQGTSSKTHTNSTLYNSGLIVWEGSGILFLGNASKVENLALFEIRNGASLSRASGVLPVFNNRASGIIRKLGNEASTTIGQSITFNNDGLLEVLNGSLVLNSNGAFNGILNVKNGSTLILGLGQITWSSLSSLISNGNVLFSSGTYSFQGGYEVLKKTSIISGTTSFSGTVTMPGDTLLVTGGVINFNGPLVTIPTIQLSSGEIGGTGKLRLASLFSWSGGSIAGTDTLNIPGSTTMQISGEAAKNLKFRTVNNLGTIIWEGTGFLNMGDGAKLNNAGLFEIRNSTSVARISGVLPTLTNLGTGIIRKVSSGTTTIGQGLILNNQGLLELSKGDLILGSTSTITGILRSSDSTNLFFQTGMHNFNTGATLDIGGAVEIKSGTTRLNIDYTLPPGLLFSGGEFGGSGIIQVSDTLFWIGGNLIDTTRLIITEQGLLQLSGIAAKAIRQRNIVNYGTINISALGVNLAPYTSINNYGQLNLTGPIDFMAEGGSGPLPVFNNFAGGTITINPLNGKVSIVGPNFNNRGTVYINKGLFNIQQAATGGLYTQTGGSTHLDSTEFTALRQVLINGGMVTGNGTIKGSLRNAGTISPGISTTKFGIIKITGQYIQDTSGVVLIDIGGKSPGSGHDQLITGIADLAGDLTVTYVNNFIPAPVEKFKIVKWLQDIGSDRFDTIFNPEFEPGKLLEPRYSVNDLTLFGPLAENNPWVQVLGRDKVRPGAENLVKVIFGNESKDTLVYPIVLEFKDIDDFRLLFDYVHFPSWMPWEDSLAIAAYNESVKNTFSEEGVIRMPLIFTIPGRPSGDVSPNIHEFTIAITPKCDKDASISVFIGEAITPDIQDCLWDIAGQLAGFLPGGHCVEAGVKIVMSGMKAYAADLNGQPITLSGWVASNGFDVVKCAASFIPGVTFVTKLVDVVNMITSGKELAELAYHCGSALFPNESGVGSSLSFTCVSSLDPNEKTGPTGAGPAKDIMGEGPLAYTIFFENIDTATAPAQVVMISDTLQAGYWDFSTFSFTGISFGDTSITPPFYVSDFYMEVDLRPVNDIITGITGEFDELTGVVTWIFESLDPLTGLPTTDPLAGFLPPNVLSPEGEGTVSYIIQPNLDLPSGTVIGSEASIVFDTNEPIITNNWENRIDKTLPVSSMEQIKEIQDTLGFDLRWTGSDEHSGIENYRLYVSGDSGVFYKIVTTPDTSYYFVGDTCAEYDFYVVAVDRTGNTEKKSTKEISILVNPFVTPELSLKGDPVFCEGDSVLINTEARNNLFYQWYLNNELVPDAHVSSLYAKIPGNYSVFVGLSESCGSKSEETTITMNDKPVPVITASENILESTPGITYQWYLNSELLEEATGQTYTASIGGNYHVIITDNNGCSGMSDVYVHQVLGAEIQQTDEFRIYPNPASDILFVQKNLGISKYFTLAIIDTYGRTLYVSDHHDSGNNEPIAIGVKSLVPGVYYLRFMVNGKIVSHKFVKK